MVITWSIGRNEYCFVSNRYVTARVRWFRLAALFWPAINSLLPNASLRTWFEEEVFTTEVDLRIIVLNPGSDQAVLYFGGNADSMALNAPELSFVLPELTIYLVNYRGYGGSGGAPTEAGLYSDALFLFDELSQRHVATYVVGRSLGSGVAT